MPRVGDAVPEGCPIGQEGFRMIDVCYTLHDDDGEIQSEERRSEQVPRIGDLLTFGPYGHSYQVVDVLWYLPEKGDRYVTVTACELNWHENIKKIMTEWRDTHGSQD